VVVKIRELSKALAVANRLGIVRKKTRSMVIFQEEAWAGGNQWPLGGDSDQGVAVVGGGGLKDQAPCQQYEQGVQTYKVLNDGQFVRLF
jgi:hypothetical protein